MSTRIQRQINHSSYREKASCFGLSLIFSSILHANKIAINGPRGELIAIPSTDSVHTDFLSIERAGFS